MNGQMKEKIYFKEDFYKGMAAIVSQQNWQQLSLGSAVAVADKATSGACHPGDIGKAFVELCNEKERREICSSKAGNE
jgi:hypothetical protein|tara:strand:- start:280 stop:513 length:234 start_codon:yes stop_codon:yes gene_type:complete